jgi:MoaA/NifB/PqqE/SkfB family radical SAM enzyme
MITKNAELFKKAPSWIYKIGAQAYIDKRYPRHLFIETTASCNLTCEYCPREKIKNHMDFELFKRIIDEAKAYGPRSFSLHLFGEPLLYPRIWDAIRYIKSANKKNIVLLTSNGTLFNRYIDEITESNVDKLIWSWRPEAKFTEETKERLRQWGRMTVRMIDTQIPKEEEEYWGNWPSVEKRELHNYGGQINLSKFGVQSISGERYPCYHLWLAPAVSWNGKFLMCCADSGQKEVFGDINKESVAVAWQRLNNVRKAHMEGIFQGICENCDVYKNYPDLFFSWQKS